MKNFYTLVILLSLGIAQIYAQTPCYLCDSTTKAFTLGSFTTARGNNSFAGGIYSTVTNHEGFAFGYHSTVDGLRGIVLGKENYVYRTDGIAIGSNAISDAINSYVFGQNITGSGEKSITIGMGSSGFQPLLNNKAGSIMFGVTQNPSLTIIKPNSSANIGYLGIGTEEPKQMVHIDEGNLLITSVNSGSSNAPQGALIFSDIINNSVPYGRWSVEYLSSTHPNLGGQGLSFGRYYFKHAPESHLFLSNDGNVGIGNSNPQAKLDVNGLFKAQDVTVENTLQATNLNVANLITSSIGTTGCSDFIIKTNNIERMRLNRSGFAVGIGTSAPKAYLHLHSSNVTEIDCGQISDPQDKSYINLPTGNRFLQISAHNATNGFTVSYNGSSKNVFFRQLEQGNIFMEGPGGGLTIAPNGNMGVGTAIPKQKLHIVDGNILISKTSAKTVAPGSPNGSILFGADIDDNFPMGKWGIEYLNGEDGCHGLNFWRPWNPGGGGWGNYYFVLADNGNVGIGKKNPETLLDVNGSFRAQSANITGAITAQSATVNGNLTVKEGSNYSVSLGNAGGQNLGWGTSYIGFNATRNNSAGNWTVEGDGAHNGSSVIWSNVQGDICFASIPSTSGNNKTLSDLNIKNNIKLQLLSNGILRAKEVQVSLSNWPDYVFSKDYNLLPLSEVEQFITENHHLPDVPSAAEVEANGVNVGEMNAILLKKVEELTLYIIEQEKQMKELGKRLNEIENRKGGEK